MQMSRVTRCFFTPLLLRGASPLIAAHRAHSSPYVAQNLFRAYSGGVDGQDPLRDVDISYGSAFAGLTTFANLPYANCFAEGNGLPDAEPFDIAFLGAPLDTATTGRPGARFGPKGIRKGSERMLPDFGWDMNTEENPFLKWGRIVDCGDVPLTWLDNRYAIKQLEKAHGVITGRKANSTEYPIPRVITLGGDHLTTLPALRAAFKRWGQVSVIHFDSHLDTWDPQQLGGDVSEYAGVNHGTFLHVAAEEGLVRNSSIHVGVRGPIVKPELDLDNDARCGFAIVKARALDRIGIQGVIDKVKKRVGGSKVYISVDIDVLDPAFAPGTGTAEVGGWSTRELLSIIDGLDGLEVIGADVVEVSPPYDNTGETTLLAAAQVAQSLLTLMVNTPVKA